MPEPADRSTTADDRHWYAVYTRSRFEKRAAQQVGAHLLECFVPLYRVSRQWQHRKACFELPLFPGYFFVRMNRSERINVVTTPGVLYIVSNKGIPNEIEESQIEALRTVLLNRKAFPTEYLAPGKRVRFAEGVFAGLEGTIAHCKGEYRVLVSIDAIMSSISIEADTSDLCLVPNSLRKEPRTNQNQHSYPKTVSVSHPAIR